MASSSASPPTSPLTCSLHITTLLKRLHTLSSTQEAAIPASAYAAIRSTGTQTDLPTTSKAMDELMHDKFIALDEDKALFVYNLLLSTGATTVVEAGTSFGVSTFYWALAVGKNAERAATSGAGGAGGPARASRGERRVRGMVIATEKEESKAEVARGYWKEAGREVEECISLRVGDLNETLKGGMGLEEGRMVDALVLDIWPYVALPALELVMPKLRPGAVVITDNTISSAEGYKGLLKVLRDPAGPFRSVTLPFKGGLEMSVYDP